MQKGILGPIMRLTGDKKSCTVASAILLGMVICGQLLQSFHVDYTAQVMTFKTSGTQFKYNLWEGVREFWKHDVKVRLKTLTIFRVVVLVVVLCC